MQRHSILKNNRTFSGISEFLGYSRLRYSDDYYANIEGQQGKIVTSDNVRAFLKDTTKNTQIITGFFNYFNSHTDDQEYREIYYNDSKLADVFNNYYYTSVLSGTPSTSEFIDNQLLGYDDRNSYYVKQYIVEYYDFDYLNQTVDQKYYEPSNPWRIPFDLGGNDRVTDSKIEYVMKYSGESYFLNVYLERTSKTIKKQTFKPCEEGIYHEILEGVSSSSYYGDYGEYGQGYTKFGVFINNPPSPLNYRKFTQIANETIANDFIVTGSLALARYGVVYRKNVPNDIDLLSNNPELSKLEDLSFKSSPKNEIKGIGELSVEIVPGYTVDKDTNEDVETEPDSVQTKSKDVRIEGHTDSRNVKLLGVYNEEIVNGEIVPQVPKAINMLLETYPGIETINKINGKDMHGEYDTYLLEGGPVIFNFFAIKPENLELGHMSVRGTELIPEQNGFTEVDHIFDNKKSMNRPKDIADKLAFKSFGEFKALEDNTFKMALAQCFVDLNINANHNEFWTTFVKEVKFRDSFYRVDEGDSVIITIDLSEPSEVGSEIVDIILDTEIGYYTSDGFGAGDIHNITSNQQVIKTLQFDVGEQSKSFSLSAILDIFEEDQEFFNIKFGNLQNVTSGSPSFAKISIRDRTEKRTVSLVEGFGEESTIDVYMRPAGEHGGSYPLTTLGAYNYNVNEPVDPLGANTYSVDITLDSPSVTGKEFVFLWVTPSLGNGPIHNVTQEEATAYSNSAKVAGLSFGSAQPEVYAEISGFNPITEEPVGPIAISPLPSRSVGSSQNIGRYVYKIMWDVGQKVKTFTFQILGDDNMEEGTEVAYLMLHWRSGAAGDLIYPANGSQPYSSYDTVNYGDHTVGRILIKNTLPEHFLQKYTTLDFHDIYIDNYPTNNNIRLKPFYNNDIQTTELGHFYRGWDYLLDGGVYQPNINLNSQGFLGKNNAKLKITNEGDFSVNLSEGLVSDVFLESGESVELFQSAFTSNNFDKMILSLPTNHEFIDNGVNIYRNTAKYSIGLTRLFHQNPSGTLININSQGEFDFEMFEFTGETLSDSIINRKHAITRMNSMRTNFQENISDCSTSCKDSFNNTYRDILFNGILLNSLGGGSPTLEYVKFIDQPLSISTNTCTTCVSGQTTSPDPGIDRLIPFITSEAFVEIVDELPSEYTLTITSNIQDISDAHTADYGVGPTDVSNVSIVKINNQWKPMGTYTYDVGQVLSLEPITPAGGNLEYYYDLYSSSQDLSQYLPISVTMDSNKTINIDYMWGNPDTDF